MAMKAVRVFAMTLLIAGGVFAQTENPKTRERMVNEETDQKVESSETVKPAPQPTVPATDPVKPVPANDDAVISEDQVVAYYSNYLKEYRLGPNDVISVEVFGQCPDYCKVGLTVPPTARISYPLIREGVMVGGKTVEQVADEITKKLDEFIIDPKVTVTLEKAMSVRYSVMGNVVSPGVRIMDRKVSLYEAVIEAGGIGKNGDKKKIALIRYDAKGNLSRQEINLAEIEAGKAPMIYLDPGDQVFVPKKGFSLNWETFGKVLGQASVVRLLFGSPF
jgi:polysaccharide export outer membrane protein